MLVETKIRLFMYYCLCARHIRYGGNGRGKERLVVQPTKQRQTTIVGREDAVQTAAALPTARRRRFRAQERGQICNGR